MKIVEMAGQYSGRDSEASGGYQAGDWGGLPGSGEILTNFADPGRIYPDYPGRDEPVPLSGLKHHPKTSSAPGRMINRYTAGRRRLRVW